MPDPTPRDIERAREILCGRDLTGEMICVEHVAHALAREREEATAAERERWAAEMDRCSMEHARIAAERRNDDMEMARTHSGIAHTYGEAARRIRAGASA
jgi:hypothetical protein